MKKNKVIQFDDMISELPLLSKRVEKAKNSHKNSIKILKLYNKINNIVNKYKQGLINNMTLYLKYQAEMASDYLLLNEYLDNDEISYLSMTVLSPSADKIKNFIKYAHTFDDKTFWEELAEAYTLQDYKKISRKVLIDLFSADRKYRECLMTKDERIYLQKLPQNVTIYRGGASAEFKSMKFGISWTLDKKIAQSFAEKKAILTKKEMKVHELNIKKDEIIAIFLERKESEVIWFKK
jgi:hypothetical protein